MKCFLQVFIYYFSLEQLFQRKRMKGQISELQKQGPKGQVVRQKRQRGRKNRLLADNDTTSQRYECFCARQYLSYPSLYMHIRNKHAQFFEANLNFASCNLIDTFDPNHGYKIRKVLKEQVNFFSDVQVRKQQGIPAPEGLKFDNGSVKMGNESQVKAVSQSSSVRGGYPIKNDSEVQESFPVRPVADLKSGMANQQQASIRLPRNNVKLPYVENSPTNRMPPVSYSHPNHYPVPLPPNNSSEYAINKIEECQLYETRLIEGIGKKLQHSTEIKKATDRKVRLEEAKEKKYDEIIRRRKSIVESYEKILKIINIKSIFGALDTKIKEQESDSQSFDAQQFI